MNENDVSYRCVKCASFVGSHDYAHTLVVISNTPEGIEKESFAICSKCRDNYVNELSINKA